MMLTKRAANFRSREGASIHFGLYDGQALHAFAGASEGAIALVPRGSQGFGWDAIFIPRGSHKTWAEMTEEEAQATSIRAITHQT